MTPVTKFEKQCAELSKKMPRLSDSAKQWFDRQCGVSMLRLSARKAWCSRCCQPFTFSDEHQKQCPCCGAHFTHYDMSRIKRTDFVREYMVVMHRFGNVQAIVYYLTEQSSLYRIGRAIKYREVMHQFLDLSDEKQVRTCVFARSVAASYRYYDWWIDESAISLKRYQQHDSRYETQADYVYPRSTLCDIVRRNGFKLDCHYIAASRLLRYIVEDSNAEYLLKMRQFALLKLYCESKPLVEQYMQSVRIAVRHGLTLDCDSARMYVDYLSSLHELGCDMHSPHYLCPTDLRQAHDNAVERVHALRLKRDTERAMQSACLWSERYAQSRHCFLALAINTDRFYIRVLQDVKAFAEEGLAMHHCVFSAAYYKRKDSLILSARSTDDNSRLETIEVDLQSLQVVQSRALCNGRTALHDDIVKAVNDAMPQIARCKNEQIKYEQSVAC